MRGRTACALSHADTMALPDMHTAHLAGFKAMQSDFVAANPVKGADRRPFAMAKFPACLSRRGGFALCIVVKVARSSSHVYVFQDPCSEEHYRHDMVSKKTRHQEAGSKQKFQTDPEEQKRYTNSATLEDEP